MDNKINDELLKLQDQLSALGQAVTHIEKAEKTATTVVDSAKSIQQKYEDHLASIKERYESYFEQAYQNLESKVNELTDLHQAQNKETTKLLADYQQKTKDAEEKSLELINQSTTNTARKIDGMTNAYQQQLDEVNGLLTGYLELAQSTAKLQDEIESIDFPMHLEKSNQMLSDINAEIAIVKLKTTELDQSENIELIKTKVARNKRKLNTILFFIVVILIVVLGFGVDLLLEKYPDLFYFLTPTAE